MSKKVPTLHCIGCDNANSPLIKNSGHWVNYIRKVIANGDLVAICTYTQFGEEVHNVLKESLTSVQASQMVIVYDPWQNNGNKNAHIITAKQNFEIESYNNIILYNDSSDDIEAAKNLGIKAFVMSDVSFDEILTTIQEETNTEELTEEISQLTKVTPAVSHENLTSSTSSVETNIKLTQPDYNLSVTELSGENNSDS